MPIYTNDPDFDEDVVHLRTPLRSSVGIGPKVTDSIKEATSEWLDKHPEATTTVEDGAITTPKIADNAVTTPKIADGSVTYGKINDSTLPTMSTSSRGIAKVGAGLAMNGDALELDGDGDIATAVESWLDAHPEATTTVQDNSITDAKLVQSGGILESIDFLYNNIGNTANLNKYGSGRYHANSSGEIVSSGNKYVGMTRKIPCDANTEYYACSFGLDDDVATGIAISCFFSWYEQSGAFIEMTPVAIDAYNRYSYDGLICVRAKATSPSNAAFAYVHFYCTSDIDNDATIQFGSEKSDTYVDPFNDDDWNNGKILQGVIERSRNLLPEVAIANGTKLSNAANGIKVENLAGGIVLAIYRLIDNVTSDDVGRSFSFSCTVDEVGTPAYGLGFVSNLTKRVREESADTGYKYARYTIASNDVGRSLSAVIWPSFSSSAVAGEYVVVSEQQVEEDSAPSEYIKPYTAVDMVARESIGTSGALRFENLELSGVYTESFALIYDDVKNIPHVLRCRAKYTGSQPTITFSCGSMYVSPAFDIGGDDAYDMNTWRLPAPMDNGRVIVNVNVPNGTVLTIDYLCTEHAGSGSVYGGGVRFNSHLGFMQMAPENTMPAFELAGELGYQACIVVPKVTSDGVLVCIHDDTINATARDEYGNPPSTTMSVSSMTYSDLLEWDFGRKRNDYWIGTKIPTIDEFFGVCAKYHMKPMFSTHPDLTAAQWNDVKSMLVKHGLLRDFHVKTFSMSILNTAYSVFGQEIDGYTGEHGDSYVSIPALQGFVSTNGIDLEKCRVVSEKSINTITEEYVTDVLAAGLQCACYTITSSNPASRIKELMSWGVTEFTDNTYCQAGMDW